MIVGILEVSIHIPESHSLKEKRHVIRSIKDRIRSKFNVSLAETDGQDTWQLCVLAAVMVATSHVAIEKEFQSILRVIEANPSIMVSDQWIDFI